MFEGFLGHFNTFGSLDVLVDFFDISQSANNLACNQVGCQRVREGGIFLN